MLISCETTINNLNEKLVKEEAMNDERNFDGAPILDDLKYRIVKLINCPEEDIFENLIELGNYINAIARKLKELEGDRDEYRQRCIQLEKINDELEGWHA